MKDAKRLLLQKEKIWEDRRKYKFSEKVSHAYCMVLSNVPQYCTVALVLSLMLLVPNPVGLWQCKQDI